MRAAIDAGLAAPHRVASIRFRLFGRVPDSSASLGPCKRDHGCDQRGSDSPHRWLDMGVLRMLLVRPKQIRDRDRQEGDPRKGNTEQPSIACASQFCNKDEGGEIWPRISRSAGLKIVD